MDTNRQPPYSESAEKSILGSILLDPYRVMFLCQQNHVTADTFYVPALRLVWLAFVAVSNRPKTAIDCISVSEELRGRGELDKIGGSIFLERLIDSTPTAAHAAHYVEIVRDMETRRNAIESIRNAEQALFDTGVCHSDTVAKLEAELLALQISNGLEVHRIIDYKDGKIEQWKAAKGKGYVGIPTSFTGVNQYLGGWRKQVMAILGGYRGCGKSTAARGECLWLGKEGYKVALFSLEDPGDQAAASIVGNHANMSTFALDVGVYADVLAISKISTAWDGLADLPLWIVAASMTCDQIVATATMLKREHGIDILFIDHIQLVKPYELPHSNRNNTLAVYSQTICALAKTLDIPIICLSQLSRAPEQGNRKPKLSDLRDSGTLEQDARQVLLLYRENEKFQLEVAKNNFGVSGKAVELKRIDGKQRFEEASPARKYAEEAKTQADDGLEEY